MKINRLLKNLIHPRSYITIGMDKKKGLSEVQKMVDKWIKEYGGGYWDPLSMFAALMEEAGELAREINYQQGYKPKKSKNARHNIKEEIGDLFFALICIANYFDIDLESELKKTLSKFTERDGTRFL